MFPVSLQRSSWTLLAGLCLVSMFAVPVAQSAVLDLAEAQSRALAFSPHLAAADLGQKAVAARRDQAGRRPNPGLEMEWENFAGSGEFSGIEASEWTLSVSQVFDLGGKRGLLQDEFSREQSLMELEKMAALLDLRQEVGLAFAGVWFAQESVTLAHDQKELAILLQNELSDRLKAGGSSAIEVTRARVDVAAAQMALIHVQESLRIAIGNLASLWGSDDADFSEVTISPEFWNQSAAQLADISTANNPDISRWGSVRILQNARIKTASAANRIDLELALGMKLEKASGDRAFVFGAGIPLPTSDRNQDEIRALGYELQQVDKLELDTANRLQSQLAAEVGSQTIARREMDIMSDEIIPLAQQAYEETRTAHQRGLLSLTDVLSTRNGLFDLRQGQLESQHNFFTATVMISRLTGHGALEIAPVTLEEK